jgi:hypothetical protein
MKQLRKIQPDSLQISAKSGKSGGYLAG